MSKKSDMMLKVLQGVPEAVMEGAPPNIKKVWEVAQLLKGLKKIEDIEDIEDAEDAEEEKEDESPQRALFPKEIKTIQEHCMKILLDSRVPEDTVEVRLDGIKLEMRRLRNDDDAS